jgi:5-phospho-D-xylono-1,4-lactonase
VIVRTVLGDVAPDALGITLGHEHLVARPPADLTDADLTLDDEDAAVRELASLREAGGTAVVEMTTVDYGRDVAALQRVSRQGGVHVIAATGFNKGRFADAIVARHDDDAIVAWMIDEVRVRAAPYVPPDRVALRRSRDAPDGPPDSDTPPARAGLIKAATGAEGPGRHERRVLDAAIAAHHATGAPIGTHTERAVWALEQARAFVDGGVPPGKVLIGHCDFRPELPYLLEIAATGVHIGLDQFSKHKYLSDGARVRLVVELASAGHLRQLILSGDLARKSYWPAYGHADAPGFAHVPRTVAGMLRAEGFGDADVDVLLRHNPSRWLAFVPR